jgi:hypothetical protein
MNIPLRGRILHLLFRSERELVPRKVVFKEHGVSSLPVLSSRCKIHPIPITSCSTHV